MERVVRLAAVGDLMLSGDVTRRMPAEPPEYPLGFLHPVLQAQDVVFANLETPLTDRFAMRYEGDYPRFAAPTAFAARLASSGITVVSLANNHILDQGIEGLNDTLEALAKAGVQPSGILANICVPQVPVIVTKRGLRLGFLSYSMSHVATDATPGAAPADIRRIAQEISETRRRTDIVVVSLHVGYEYAPAPGLRALSLILRTLRRGADVVLGHHPHVPQGLVRSGGGVALCSLGNCVADMGSPLVRELSLKRAASEGNPFAAARSHLSVRGILAEFAIGLSGVSLETTEIGIDEDCAPRPMGLVDLTSFGRPTYREGVRVEAVYQLSRIRGEGLGRICHLAQRLVGRGSSGG